MLASPKQVRQRLYKVLMPSILPESTERYSEVRLCSGLVQNTLKHWLNIYKILWCPTGKSPNIHRTLWWIISLAAFQSPASKVSKYFFSPANRKVFRRSPLFCSRKANTRMHHRLNGVFFRILHLVWFLSWPVCGVLEQGVKPLNRSLTGHMSRFPGAFPWNLSFLFCIIFVVSEHRFCTIFTFIY